MRTVDDEVTDLGDALAFLKARIDDDMGAALVIVKNTEPARLLMSLTDFTGALLKLYAELIGVEVSMLLIRMMQTTQFLGPDKLTELREKRNGSA